MNKCEESCKKMQANPKNLTILRWHEPSSKKEISNLLTKKGNKINMRKKLENWNKNKTKKNSVEKSSVEKKSSILEPNISISLLRVKVILNLSCKEWKWSKINSWVIHKFMILHMLSLRKILRKQILTEKKMEKMELKWNMNNSLIKDCWPREWENWWVIKTLETSCKKKWTKVFWDWKKLSLDIDCTTLSQTIRTNFTFLKRKITCQKLNLQIRDLPNPIILIQSQIYTKILRWESLKEVVPKSFQKDNRLKTVESKEQIPFKSKMVTLWPSFQAIWWIFNNKMFKTAKTSKVALWASTLVDKPTLLASVLVLNQLERSSDTTETKVDQVLILQSCKRVSSNQLKPTQQCAWWITINKTTLWVKVVSDNPDLPITVQQRV